MLLLIAAVFALLKCQIFLSNSLTTTMALDQISRHKYSSLGRISTYGVTNKEHRSEKLARKKKNNFCELLEIGVGKNIAPLDPCSRGPCITR